MKAIKLIITILIILSYPVAGFAETQEEYNKLSSEYKKLEQEMTAVVQDRDNLRKQAQFLLKYKQEIVTAQQAMLDIEQERSRWELERETLKAVNKKLEGQLKLLEAQVGNLGITQMQIEEERDNIKKTLSKSKAGYIIVDDLKRQINDHIKENSRLMSEMDRLKKSKMTWGMSL